MIRPLALAAALLGLAGPALAAAPTASDCAGFTAIVPAVRAARAEPAGDDGCVFHDVMFSFSRFQRLHADTITVHRVDFARLAARQPQLSLRIEAAHASFRAGIDNPVMNYITSVTAKPFDIVLDYAIGGDDGPLKLNRFSVDGPLLGSLLVTGEVAGAGPNLLHENGEAAAKSLALRAVSLRFDNKVMFETFAVPFLAGVLLADAPDPEAKVEGLKAEAIAIEEKRLGEAGVGADTRQALARFLKDLPHPNGVLAVTGDFPRPLTEADLQALRAGGAPNLTDGRTLTVTYP
jgi:hypothetical protein